MATVLNRTTKQLLQSVNTPEFPSVDWIINPDLLAVAGIHSRYWKISGDTVSAMTQVERDAVDAQESAAAVTEARAAEAARYDEERLVRAVALVMLDSFNLQAGRVNAILDAIDAAASLAALKTSVAAISNLPRPDASALRDAIRAKLQEV